MLNLRVVAVAVLVGLALPAAAQEDETFVEIKPGDVSADPDNLIRGAEQGDVRALNNLGLLWARGVGVPAPDRAHPPDDDQTSHRSSPRGAVVRGGPVDAASAPA